MALFHSTSNFLPSRSAGVAKRTIMEMQRSMHEGRMLPCRPEAFSTPGAIHVPADAQVRTPRHILLGTDLSIRCERALSRVAGLREEWNSELTVLHVIDPAGESAGIDSPSPWPVPDRRQLTWRALLSDVAVATPQARLLMGEGEPSEVMVSVVATQRCDLVVMGPAREAFLGRMLLDRTTDRVLRQLDVPVLVVKDRPRRPYHDVIVASDLSDVSLHALNTATAMFPDRRFIILHAYGMVGALPTGRGTALRDCGAFASRSEAQQSLRCVVEEGWPPALVRDYVLAAGIDLVVLGTRRHSQIREMFMGSIGKAIMDEVPCDVLIVPQP